MERTILVVAIAITVAAVTVGCTAPNRPPAPSTEYSTTTITEAPGTVGPISSGPTTAATARSCPFIAKESAAARVGMRLDAIRVLSSGGRVVGCRFYPLGHPNAQCDAACLDNEHLPPTSQPAIEISSARYTSAADAHNEVAMLGTAGTNPQQRQIASGVIGVCYQTDFYLKDRGKDWGCAFSRDAVVVVVRTVAAESFDAVRLTRGVAPKF